MEAIVWKQHERDGTPLPKEIANAPTLDIGLGLYWQAFVDLSTCRSIGMSAGSIPWLAILQYANEFDFQGFQRAALFHHLRAMDNAFLSYNKAKE